MTNDEAVNEVSESGRFLARQQTSRQRRKVKAVALLLLAVAAGAVIGAGATLLYVRNTMYRLPPRPRAIGDAMLGHLRGLTTLTPEEDAAVAAVVDSHVKEVEALRKDMYGEIRGVFRDMNEEIGVIIGPERMEKWRLDKEKRYGKRRSRDNNE